MRPDEAEARLRGLIRPTRQQVLLARIWIEQLPSTSLGEGHEVRQLIHRFALEQGASEPPRDGIVVHDDADTAGQLEAAATYVNLTLAAVQAIWELSSENRFMPMNGLVDDEHSIPWTTIFRRSGGSSGGWRLQDHRYSIPRFITRSPVASDDDHDAISSAYEVEAGLVEAHPEVQEAVRDAVACLKRALYRPAVVMLGKAMEGAWIEAGLALSANEPDAKRRAVSAAIFRNDDSIAKKLREARRLYERDWAASIRERASVQPLELDSAAIWSDVVRDSRNAIHFEAAPATGNTYEKATALFLGGARFLPMLYRIKAAATP